MIYDYMRGLGRGVSHDTFTVRQKNRVRKMPNQVRFKNIISCHACGSLISTMLKDGDKYICKKCKSHNKET